MVVIVDYGVGNPAAIANMLRHLGVRSELTGAPEAVAAADRIILPGVGHFDHCVDRLTATELVEPISAAARQRGVPLLGICVGAQLLGRGSEEGSAPGLGWLDMVSKRLEAEPGYRVPRMGWGEVDPAAHDPLMSAPDGSRERFYFAHSYCLDCADPSIAAATTTYGRSYVCAVRSDNVAGVQFHPEKSHRYGMALLKRFVEWMP